MVTPRPPGRRRRPLPRGWQNGAMLRIGTIVVNVSDRGRSAEFWSKALGYELRGGGITADESAVLVCTAGSGTSIALDQDDQMHLDLQVDNQAELDAEVERLIILGARRVDWMYPDGAAFVVLSDTEGNVFCVVNAGANVI